MNGLYAKTPTEISECSETTKHVASLVHLKQIHIGIILPRDPQGLGQNGEGNRTSLASSVSEHVVTGRHRTSFQRRKRRIPQVKPVTLKQIQTLYLSAKTGPFLSQPSHPQGVKDDSRHRLSTAESRRAERKTNRELVRREREDRRSERECRRQRWHQQRKRRLGQVGRKRTLYSQVAWVGSS
ncbi:hypothetical protein M9H77_03716 [Catharanthus roseus]|uniref:Uncharacterized protein n=1 Tax=Catharanthus roseus TaxID=4058 RepID=A0ACC0CCG3_CATRO|nr:hypothetical protein M9H77_03716 [Catharanthus roseus]